MYGERTDRIVDAQLVEHRDRIDDEYAADNTDDNRLVDAVKVRTRCYGNQTAQRAVEDHRDIEAAVLQQHHKTRGDRTGQTRCIGVHDRQGHRIRILFGSDRTDRTAVKTEPADPQQHRTEYDQRNVRRRDDADLAVLVASLTCAHDQNRRQQRPAARGVDHRGAGKIVHIQIKQCSVEEVRSPGDVDNRRVDESAHNHGKDSKAHAHSPRRS